MRGQLATGKRIGRYELLLPAARGGMAEVWAARLHGIRGFQKLVAVKSLREDICERERLEQMFFEEAKLASKIRHPNVVETFELGEADGAVYLVMEWVDGESLRQIQKENQGLPLPLTVAVHLIAQCCKGLHAAHELEDEHGKSVGLVHRDVSPHNIMVTYDGVAKLTDFGVAKVTNNDHELTRAGEVKGKIPYMAPEYIEGKAVDRRADLFALGLVLYELTTGHHPFRGATPAQTIRNLSSSEAAPPRKFASNYPTALSAVVRKAIRLEPVARFATAMDFLAMLQEAMPEAFTRDAEEQTKSYLQRLLGMRAAMRHAELQRALAKPSQSGLLFDAAASPTGQSGTIGAVVTEELDQSLVSTRTALSRRRGKAKYVLFGAALALAGVVGGGALIQRANVPVSSVAAPHIGVDVTHALGTVGLGALEEASHENAASASFLQAPPADTPQVTPVAEPSVTAVAAAQAETPKPEPKRTAVRSRLRNAKKIESEVSIFESRE